MHHAKHSEIMPVKDGPAWVRWRKGRRRIAGIRVPRCTSYAQASQMMLCLEGRSLSAVERPGEVVLEGTRAPFISSALRSVYLYG